LDRLTVAATLTSRSFRQWLFLALLAVCLYGIGYWLWHRQGGTRIIVGLVSVGLLGLTLYVYPFRGSVTRRLVRISGNVLMVLSWGALVMLFIAFL
jgi:hypothetical protein